MKKIVFGILFVSLFIIGLVNAEMLQSEAGVLYDSGILKGNEWHKGFDQGAEWVLVIVSVKDFSGIVIDFEKDSIEIQEEKWNNKEIIFEKTLSEVVGALSEDEFIIEDVLLWKNGFGGKMSKGGFEKLITIDYVEAIYIEKEGKVDIISINDVGNKIILFPVILLCLIVSLSFMIYRMGFRKD
jgi:hypothetical protein